MFNKIKTFIYILAFVVPCLVCFSTFSNQGYCSSVALSGQASSTLGNSLGSVFDLSGISASPDPVGLSIGLSQIYDKLDLYLYQNYDYDLSGTVNDTLESGMPYINQDAVLQDSFVSKITNGLYNTMQELTGYGYALYKAATIGIQNAKDTFFIGKEQDGVVSEVLDNALVYVDDDVLSAYSSAVDNAIIDNDLYNLSVANHFLFGKNFHFLYSGINWTLNFQDNVCLFTQVYGGQRMIFMVTEYSYNHNFAGSGVMVSRNNPTVITSFSNDDAYTASSFVVNNKTYYVSALKTIYQSGSAGYVYSDVIFGDYASTVNSLQSSSGVASGVYSLSPDIEATIQDLLAELKGHYVSTSDLDLIIDSLSDNGVITNEDVVIEGVTENVPVLDWTQDYIDTLEGIIESVLERSAIYDDVISDSNAVTPDPPINDNEFYGTSIPNGFDTSSWGSVFDVFKVPFNFVSFFEPLFYVFGGFSGVFAIWSIVPFVFVIMLLIWALK